MFEEYTQNMFRSRGGPGVSEQKSARLILMATPGPTPGRHRRAAAAGEAALLEPQDWSRYPGEGVDARPCGMPSPFEARVVHRNVPWLTADPVSSVSFTPLHELNGIRLPNEQNFFF